MTFITASLAIAGACAVAIPILIHLLFRRRRKPIEWAAMRFLLEAYRKHRRRLQLEQILLLAVRCLIVAILGFALARPLLEDSGLLPGGSRAIMLVIDNSMTSGVKDAADATALARQAESARAILDTLSPGDTAALITTARPARAVVVPPSSDHEAVKELVGSLTPSEAANDLPAALGLLRTALDDIKSQRSRAVVYLMGEFRAGSARLDAPLPEHLLDLGEDVKLLHVPPSQEPAGNVQVVSVEPLRQLILSGEDEGLTQVLVRLARHGGELGSQVTRVRLSGEGLPAVEPRTVQWVEGQPRAEVDFLVDFRPGEGQPAALTAWVEEDALPADNQRFSVVQLREKVRIVLIDRRSFGAAIAVDQLSTGQWIRRALAPYEDSPMDIIEVDPAALDPTDLRTADAAIMPRPDLLTDAGWMALRGFVDGGGLLIITPPSELNVHQWVDHLSTSLGLPWQVALELTSHPEGAALADEQPPAELVRMIAADLSPLSRPVAVFRRLAIDVPQTQAQRVLLMADGSPLLIVGSPQAAEAAGGSDAPNPAARGLVAFLATAPHLEWTNLPSQPLMVPLFQEMVRQGLSMVRSQQQVMVSDRPSLGLGRSAASLRSADEVSIPINSDGRPARLLEKSGLMSVLDPAGQRVGRIAVNVDAEAGRTETQTPATVSAWLSRTGPWQALDGDDPAAALRSVQSGWPLAGTLLLALLALIALETLLARRFSHAYQDAGSEGLRGATGSGLSGAGLVGSHAGAAA